MKHTLVILGLSFLFFLGCGAGTITALSLDEQNAGWPMLDDGTI